MASEPVINHDDLPTAARDIHREYGGPAIMLKMADEIDRLRSAIQEVKDDCEARAVDGVVPIGASAWVMVCEAIDHLSPKEELK